MSPQTWDTTLYQDQHAFVWQYGEAVLDLLAPKPGEQILDLGCGTGQLTEKIAIAQSHVSGIDADASMIAQAQQNYPHLQFRVADARNFESDRPLDAVFSNATLHWIQPPDAVIQSVYNALKPQGRFVAEFGGKGCVKGITDALQAVLLERGYTAMNPVHPWYFPSISEYTARLEHQGFEVTYAILFDRPTPLVGEAGLANWLRMFTNSVLEQFSADEQAQMIAQVEDRLRQTHYRDRTWFADYRRLRFVALKHATS